MLVDLGFFADKFSFEGLTQFAETRIVVDAKIATQTRRLIRLN